MIDHSSPLSIRQQARLLSVCRSQIYYQSHRLCDDTELANQIVEVYCQNPMYGYRRVQASLRQQGYLVNHKRVYRLMKDLNLQAVYPKPKTTIRNAAHSVYPYLLRNLSIMRPHQAWQVDITYLSTPHGFLYLCAIIDIFSRYLLAWRLSNALETNFCLDVVEDAISQYGCPEIINSDQGCQFTSHEWIKMMRLYNIKVSMCGRGRSNDNAYIERFWRTLKYEEIYLQDWKSVAELKSGIRQFIDWYNHQRLHQALDYQTPSKFLPGGNKLPDGFGHNFLSTDVNEKVLHKTHRHNSNNKRIYF